MADDATTLNFPVASEGQKGCDMEPDAPSSSEVSPVPVTGGSGGRWPLVAAVASGLAASLCCLLPLVLLALGLGGAWAAGLRALEPFRPLFVFAAGLFLAIAFYLAYRKPRACSPGAVCATSRSVRMKRVMLGVVALVVLGLLAAPYAARHVLAETSQPEAASAQAGAVEQVVLRVDSMTCTACTVTVAKSLSRLEGVRGVTITLDPSEAVVTFDPARTSIDAMARATAEVGYPSSATKAGRRGDSGE